MWSPQLHVNDLGTGIQILACGVYVIAAIMSTYFLDIKLLEEHRSVHRIKNEIMQIKVTERTEPDTNIVQHIKIKRNLFIV
jgi:hypothetical protein